jgi:hypothetical protein
MANPFEARPIGIVVLVACVYSATNFLQQYVGPQPVLAVRFLLWTLLPAMLATMSVTGSFAAALNPISVFGTIARTGIDYAMLLLVLALLWLLPVFTVYSNAESLSALWRAQSFLPMGMLPMVGVRGVLLGLIGHVYVLYAWLAMFACIGAMIYEQRHALGIEAPHAPERQAARADAELDRERSLTMDRLFAQVRGGAIANAKEHARKLIAASAQPLEECRWLLARAATLEDQRLANYIAQLVLPLLLERKATGEALQVVRDRLRVSENFRPQTGAQVMQLAELARAGGDRSTAMKLLADFERYFPGDPWGGRAAEVRAELQR